MIRLRRCLGVICALAFASFSVHAADAPSDKWVKIKTLDGIERPAGWCGTSDQIIYQTLGKGLVVEDVRTGKSHTFPAIRSASNISCNAAGTHLIQSMPKQLVGYDMSGGKVLDVPLTNRVLPASDSDNAIFVGGGEDIAAPWGTIKAMNLANGFINLRLRKWSMARGRVAIQADQNKFGGGDAYVADLSTMKMCSLGHHDRLERIEYAGNRVVIFKNMQFEFEHTLKNGLAQTGEILAMVYSLGQNCRMSHEFDVHEAACFDLANDGSYATCDGKEVKVCDRTPDLCKTVAKTDEDMQTAVSFSADGHKLLVYDTAPARKPPPGGTYRATTQVFERQIK